MGNLDLLIAGIVRKRDGILVSRDRDFQGIPGLHLESYGRSHAARDDGSVHPDIEARPEERFWRGATRGR